MLEAALDSLASSRSIALHRAVISQSRRDPALARDVFHILRAPWVAALSSWVAGLGVADDPDWYARQLLVLACAATVCWRAGSRFRRTIGGATPPGP